MNAADFLYRLSRHDPESAVLCQIPLHRKIVLLDDDVLSLGVLLTIPIPAVPSDHPSFIVFSISLDDFLPQHFGRVKNTEIEVAGVQIRICGLPDAKGVV
jgi:hypothetical protein